MGNLADEYDYGDGPTTYTGRQNQAARNAVHLYNSSQMAAGGYKVG